jgi:hypothetical protein
MWLIVKNKKTNELVAGVSGKEFGEGTKAPGWLHRGFCFLNCFNYTGWGIT